MKTFLIGVAIVFTSLSVLSQDSENRSVGSFNGIKVGQGIDVYLKKGDKESVRVVTSGIRLEQVQTDVSGSYLKISLRDGNNRGRIDVKVYVTYVNLEKIAASSAANIYSSGTIKADNLQISASSAANVEVSLEANRLDISTSSAGQVEVQGRSRKVTMDVSSAGQIDAYDLEAEEIEVEASSAGSAKVSVASSLEANASSGGSIRYRGNPARSITKSSSGGSVKKIH
jgi:hypothetical protein